MSTRLLAIISALAAIAASAVPEAKAKSSLLRENLKASPVNTTCLTTDICGSAYQTCLIHPECSKLLQCLEKCLDDFESDTTPMKSTTQSCLGTCLFSYADFYYTGLGRCLTDNDCFHLPHVTTPCRYRKGVSESRKFQISDLKGGWWKVRGFNPAYDCIPCQHTFFDGFEWTNDQFVYRPTFEVVAVNGSHVLVNGTISVSLENTKPGKAIVLDYYLYGHPNHQTWYVLDGPADNSTILIYYCGTSMSKWQYEGAMILSRSPVLKPTDDKHFAEMVTANTNLDYSKFCSPQLHPCSN